MNAPLANPNVGSATVSDLDSPQQLIVWSIRHWLDGSHDWPAIQQVFWQACGITNVEAALQGFQEMIGILSSSSRRTLYFHRPACRQVSADELSILRLISALQEGQEEHVNALISWLVPRPLESRLRGCAKCLATALHRSGNVISPIANTPLSAMAPAGTA